MVREYTIWIKCQSFNPERQNHEEIHFILADDNQDAREQADRLIRKLGTFDGSWLRTVTTILDPDLKIAWSTFL